MDQLPRLGKRELICLLLFTCNYVVSVWRGFLFLWVLGMGYVILLWHSLSLPYNYFSKRLFIGMVTNNEEFNGSYVTNPFRFTPFSSVNLMSVVMGNISMADHSNQTLEITSI